VVSPFSLACAVLVALGRPPSAPGGAGDGDLVARAQAGERFAFETLYRRHADLTYRLLTRLLGLDPDREDLVQRAWIEVFRSIGRFRGESQFATWLHRITCHVAYEHMRTARRRPDTRGANAEAELELMVAPDADPEVRLRQRESLELALALLEKIKPKKRIAFVLRTVEGLSLEEIGAIVGASAAAVGQRVRHAQEELDELARKRARRGVS
jgi:RNA polymerase sigma-70 factor (ECF subfamily)